MKNNYRVVGDTTEIYLNHKGNILTTKISTANLQKVLALPGSWYATYNPKTQGYYVKMDFKIRGLRQHHQLHRFLLDAPKGYDVDHRNGDTLDNTDGNIRVVTRSENNENAKIPHLNTSGHKGVYWSTDREKWYGQVTKDYKTYGTGYFDNLDDCVRAVHTLRKKVHKFATDRAY